MRKLSLISALLAALFAVATPSLAIVPSVNGVVLNAGATPDPRVAQDLSWPAGETGQINITLRLPSGAAYDLTGGQVLFTVRNRAGVIVLSRQATINTPASGGTVYVPLVVADTVSLAPLNGATAALSYDVWVTDASGNRYQAVPLSRFTVTPALGAPGQPVTVPSSQNPLAIGPPGLGQMQSPPGSALTQRQIITVDGTLLQATDNPGSARTDITAPGLVPKTRSIIAGAGVAGGGSLASDVTLSLPTLGPGAGTQTLSTGETLTFDAQGRVIGIAPTTRSIFCGTGLSGCGNLSLDRTLSVLYGDVAGTSIQGNSARVPPAPSTLDAELYDTGAAWSSRSRQNFDVRSYASFSAAVTAIGSTPATLAISNAQTVSASVSLPSTLTLSFTGAGQLSIASGQVVTVNGQLVAPSVQIFTGSGIVAFAQTSNWMVFPEWWGAKKDGATASNAAIQAAATSIRDRAIGGVVFIADGVYSATAQIALADTVSPAHSYANISIEGAGYGSQIVSTTCLGNGTGGTGLFYFHGTSAFSLKNVGIKKLRITGCDETTTVGPLVTFSNTDGSYVVDSYIDTTRDEGLYWNDPSSEQNITCRGNSATHVGGWNAPIASDIRSAYNINATNATFLDNRATQVGIAVEQTGSGIFIGNRIDSCGYNNPLSGGTYYTCLSMESTSASGVVIIATNKISNANLCIGFGGTATGESALDTNTLDNCNSGISIQNTTTPVAVTNNTLHGALNGSQGSAITHQSGSVSIKIANNHIYAGATQWATGILGNDTAAYYLISNNDFHGDGFTSQVIKLASGNSNYDIIDNPIEPGSMSNLRTRIQVQGVSFALTDFATDSGTILSTKRPSVTYGTAAPTTGVWLAKDVRVNTAVTATGSTSNVYWVCTTGGTPGTWTPVYIISAGTGLSQTNGVISMPNVGPGAGTYCGAGTFVTSAQLDAQGRTVTVNCATPSGTGTVTSVTCGTDLTGGTITTTGTCALATTITQALTHTGLVTFSAHIAGGGGAPTVVPQTGQCGASCTGSATGSDIAFEVTLNPSGTQVSGNQFKVTPAVTWGAVPYCVLHPTNTLARSNGSYDLFYDRANSSTSSLFFSLSTSVFTSGNPYKWIVHCTQ
jgi:hypothetical protein